MCKEMNEKRPVGGGFQQKKQRNENLRQYHLNHPKATHACIARVFKISRARVTQILNTHIWRCKNYGDICTDSGNIEATPAKAVEYGESSREK